ncbi:nitroreductase family deazaflavin-dependent oxidoreductase [Streptomyces sp. NPDC005423]|uniref:nitroreductase family deazaflavin-dependent oxidoreductase n=1 Tax=Streptomyces sp. NPDC005423 TaxID=3155343 RepID=UPI0033A5115D
MTDNLAIRLAQRVMATRAFATLAPHVIPHLDRALHRLTGGRKMLLTLPRPKVGLILTTTGAKSGQLRTTPLVCVPEEHEGTWLLVGSNFGKPGHPAWTANLRKHPDASISWAGRDIRVTAAQLVGQQRDQAWADIVAFWPPYGAYQERTEREIRIFRLTPRPSPSALTP